MTTLAFWTWVAAGVLVLVPPVILVLFLRDARQVFRDLGFGRARTEGENARREAA
jgi:heme exporter protein D